MDREQVLKWAREANNGKVREWTECHLFYLDELERFAALADAAAKAEEREAIAKMFDGAVWAYDYREIAAAIRARTNT